MTSYLPRFYAEFAPKLFKRAKTFRLMFELLDKMESPQIVETGCIRELGCWEGDGQSTVQFNDYANFRSLPPDRGYDQHDAAFVTVDICEAHVKLAASLGFKTFAVCDDSVKYLQRFQGNIDLLYLDSYDFDPANPHPSSLHHLKELAAAQKNLRPGSIIAVDDNHPDGVGKGMYVRDYLQNIGIEPIADDYQVVWMWK